MNGDHKEEEFERLLSQARSGDRTAVGELLNNFRNYLLLIANQDIDPKIKGKLGSSDIVQESMLTAHQNIDAFQGSSKPELMAWLRQILINDLHQSRRKFAGTKKRQVDLERPIQASSTFQYSLVDPNLTPKTNAISREEATLLKQCMSELNDDYATVIRLHNWEGRSFDEIAEMMDRSPDAARKLWTRALLKLQNIAATKRILD